MREQRMQPLCPAGPLTSERLPKPGPVTEPLDLRRRQPGFALRQQLAREQQRQPSARRAGRSSAAVVDPATRSPDPDRPGGPQTHQPPADARPSASRSSPRSRPRPASPSTRSPTHRAAPVMARTGSRTAHPSPDRAPPPGTPPCEYRFLRTTSAEASLRDGSWATNLPRLLEAPSTTSPRWVVEASHSWLNSEDLGGCLAGV